MLGELVRSLNRIASGVEAIVEFLDSVVQKGDDGVERVRTVSL